MEISEAIERIKTMAFMCDDFHNCKYGHDCTDGCSEAVKMAVDALQGSVKKKHIGSDNMVISSSDLMTILNSDSDKELEAYRAFGTVEEIPVLFKENHKTGYEIGYAKGIDDLVNGLLNWKSQDEEYKSFSDVCNEIAEQLKGSVE